MSDSPELLKPNGVTDKELQNELSNLKDENEKLRADYAALLESSTHVTNKLREEVRELRSQLEAKKTSWDELREELDDREETCAELRSEISDLKQKSAAASGGLPEAATILSQLRTRRKKSPVSLADIEAVLEIIEES